MLLIADLYSDIGFLLSFLFTSNVFLTWHIISRTNEMMARHNILSFTALYHLRLCTIPLYPLFAISSQKTTQVDDWLFPSPNFAVSLSCECQFFYTTIPPHVSKHKLFVSDCMKPLTFRSILNRNCCSLENVVHSIVNIFL